MLQEHPLFSMVTHMNKCYSSLLAEKCNEVLHNLTGCADMTYYHVRAVKLRGTLYSLAHQH